MPYLGPTLTHVDFTAAEVELVQRQQHRSWLRAGAGSTPSGQEYQWGAKNGPSHLRRSLGMGIDHVTIARILKLLDTIHGPFPGASRRRPDGCQVGRESKHANKNDGNRETIIRYGKMRKIGKVIVLILLDIFWCLAPPPMLLEHHTIGECSHGWKEAERRCLNCSKSAQSSLILSQPSFVTIQVAHENLLNRPRGPEVFTCCP